MKINGGSKRRKLSQCWQSRYRRVLPPPLVGEIKEKVADAHLSDKFKYMK